MMTKWSIKFFGALCALFAATHLAAAKCEGNEKVVRLAILAGGEKTAQAFLAKELQTEFQRTLNGKWCIAFVPPQDGVAPLDALRDGNSELVLTTLDNLSFAAPLHRVFELPFVFRDGLALRKFLTTDASKPLREWKGAGVRSMALVPYGLEQIGGRKGLFLPTDLAGVRFALETQQATRQMIARLRATGRAYPQTEIKKALEENRADAQMSRWQGFDLSGTSTVHSIYMLTNHAVVGAQILAAEKWISGLKAADVAALERSLKRAVDLFATRQAARENQSMKSIMGSGKPVYLLTHKQRQAWRAALQPIVQAYESLPGGKAILKGIKEAHILP